MLGRPGLHGGAAPKGYGCVLQTPSRPVALAAGRRLGVNAVGDRLRRTPGHAAAVGHHGRSRDHGHGRGHGHGHGHDHVGHAGQKGHAAAAAAVLHVGRHARAHVPHALFRQSLDGGHLCPRRCGWCHIAGHLPWFRWTCCGCGFHHDGLGARSSHRRAARGTADVAAVFLACCRCGSPRRRRCPSLNCCSCLPVVVAARNVPERGAAAAAAAASEPQSCP